MYDASDVAYDIGALHVPFEDNDIAHDTPRPTTPLPDCPRTLRRTISFASIDTVLPPNRKGIRRPIEEIAEGLKHKLAKKKRTHSPIQHGSKDATDDVALDSKASTKKKGSKRKRKAASPLRDSSHKSGESVLGSADKLDSGVLIDLDPPQIFRCLTRESLNATPLVNEDDEDWEDCGLPVKNLQPGPHVTEECHGTEQSSPTANIGIKDVELHIQSSETDVTIWDGLQAEHHTFKCRLFLQCTTHPYNTITLPHIRLVEMECNTRPAGSHYARLPILQAAYKGAVPGRVTNPRELPSVTLSAGIHMDRAWCKIQNDDNTWGWYRDAFIPLSPQLFEKMEYRKFTLVSRAWAGESYVEDKLTFGISMLLRDVDMR